MSDLSLQGALAAAAEAVLETMFFLSPLEDGQIPTAAAGPALTAMVQFEGDPPGWLSLSVTARAGRSIAADFLGECEEDLSPRQVEEVVCELANVVCGALLSRVESSAAFRLGPPSIVPAKDSADAEGAIAHRIDIQNGRIEVAIRLERRACPEIVRSVS